jgi:hypothetical protein
MMGVDSDLLDNFKLFDKKTWHLAHFCGIIVL